jgi:hypothetical protein
MAKTRIERTLARAARRELRAYAVLTRSGEPVFNVNGYPLELHSYSRQAAMIIAKRRGYVELGYTLVLRDRKAPGRPKANAEQREIPDDQS